LGEESISEDHQTYIFHSAYSEFWHKNSVILLERERAREELFKELDRFLYEFERCTSVNISSL
jgi:hypothetical protein